MRVLSYSESMLVFSRVDARLVGFFRSNDRISHPRGNDREEIVIALKLKRVFCTCIRKKTKKVGLIRVLRVIRSK